MPTFGIIQSETRRCAFPSTEFVNEEIIHADTLADLRLVDVPTYAKTAIMYGDLVKGDGGGHVYYWDAASVAADNGVSIIQSVNATGRWIQFI